MISLTDIFFIALAIFRIYIIIYGKSKKGKKEKNPIEIKKKITTTLTTLYKKALVLE